MSNPDQPMDHVPADDGVARAEPSDLEKNVKSKRTWMRLVFMVLMGIAWSITVFVTSVIVVVNFLYVLFTGKTHEQLTEFGHSLATYLFQIVEFMTFNTETRPFPIDEDWPAGSRKSEESASPESSEPANQE